MITVNLPELEELCITLSSAASDAEDIVGKMGMLEEEMDTEPAFTAFPQSMDTAELLAETKLHASMLSESLRSLSNIVSEALDGYQARENAFREKLEGALASLNAVQADISAVQTVPMTVTEPEENAAAMGQVEKLVSESSAALQLTNIAAFSKVVEEDYGVSEVHTVNTLERAVSDAALDLSIAENDAEMLKQKKTGSGSEDSL